jgi:hypothetical protein
VTRFSGEQTASGIHECDPRIGILLVGTLDELLVDRYQLGFYNVTVSCDMQFKYSYIYCMLYIIYLGGHL